MGSKYSEAEKRTLCDTINKYINEGYSDCDISDKVGVSKRTIYNMAHGRDCEKCVP